MERCCTGRSAAREGHATGEEERFNMNDHLLHMPCRRLAVEHTQTCPSVDLKPLCRTYIGARVCSLDVLDVISGKPSGASGAIPTGMWTCRQLFYQYHLTAQSLNPLHAFRNSLRAGWGCDQSADQPWVGDGHCQALA